MKIQAIYRYISFLLFSLIGFVPVFKAKAQGDVPLFINKASICDSIDFCGVGRIRQATTLGIGYLNEYDTYLSPQEYTGLSLRYRNESYRNRSWQGGDKWVTNKVLQGYIGYSDNQVRNSRAYSILITYHYGFLRRWRVNNRLQLLGGGGGIVNIGSLYNTRNGNNPAQLRFSFGALAQGMAIWNFNAFHYPFRLSYEVGIPLVGAIFMPHYGQSYYELYNYGEPMGQLKFSSPFNSPSILNLLSLDIPAWNHITLRVSYSVNIYQAKINYLRSHCYNHAFMVGVVWDSITLPSFSRKRK